MPGTFSNILLHIVFSTKSRKPLITSNIQDRLYKFLGGIIREKKCALLEIGGMPDHAHLFVRLSTDISVGELMKNVKGRSSKWLNEIGSVPEHFAWQEGYGAFSVSQSLAETVRKYIQRQAHHHATKSWEDELRWFLEANQIDFDPDHLLG